MGSTFTNPLIPQNTGEVQLTPLEQVLRDSFVKEYIVDYNAYGAALRIGFNTAFAKEFGKQFLHESYVRRQIHEHENREYSDAQNEVNKRRVVKALEREAHYNGPGASHSARIAALSKLVAIYGLEAPTKIEANLGPKGGVMIVPALLSPDAWSEGAAESQAELKRTVKE